MSYITKKKIIFFDKISALSNAEEKCKLLERFNIAKNLLSVLDNGTTALKTGLSIKEMKQLT